VDTAAETLQSKDIGEITWLEHGPRETSQGMCREALRWLLALPGLRVPADPPEPGERRLSDQARTAHTLFGDIPAVRNYYYRAADGSGRFPLDNALGLIDGYTPGLAALIGRCAAEHPFKEAEESFRAYTGLTVDARQFPRLAERRGPLAERVLRANLPSEEKTPPRVYVATTQRAEPFGQMMRAEFCRRFPTPPPEVVFLGDGAAWNGELQRIFSLWP
jgi:hypothetical protein